MASAVSRHCSGNMPSSVSSPSSRPSAPSSTMLAMSVASARVGRGAEIMLSIRRVTMHGRPTTSHMRSTCFCTANIFSASTTAPSSPRASRITSASFRMLGRSRSADRLSMRAMMRACGNPYLDLTRSLMVRMVAPERMAPKEMKSTLAGTAHWRMISSSRAFTNVQLGFFVCVKCTVARLPGNSITSLSTRQVTSFCVTVSTVSSAVWSPACR
mmetsp:Transcript_28444/g.70074  ORF Transcript_28444/g.70074 Transcript_28444/m.70074 type:complete len:214 (-) Transcript_28444:678-1319(-)